MRGLIAVIAVLAAGGGTAVAGPGVAVEAPVEAPSPFVVGAHVGLTRTVESAIGPDASFLGPWLDAEVGLNIFSGVAVLAFADYTRGDGFAHVLIGARAQFDVTPLFWVGGGAGWLHESFPALSDTFLPITDTRNLPAFELRAGFDVARIGRLRFQVIADGVAFELGSRATNGYASTMATLSLGAQFR